MQIQNLMRSMQINFVLNLHKPHMQIYAISYKSIVTIADAAP